jgi:hypothetical protein
MSRAISSVRASSAPAAALRYAARFAVGRRDHSPNASSAAATAAAASFSSDDENSPTASEGRIGLSFVYVSPDAAGTQAPPT